MKHIFHVHNQSSYLSALSIIDNYAINNNDVVFMSARGVCDGGESIQVINIDDDIYYHRFTSTRYIFKLDFLRNNKYIDVIDGWLDVIGEPYTYYVPHCRNPLYSIVITHPNCSQVHYIEDGSDAYLTRRGIQAKFPPVQHWSHKLLSPFFFFFGGERIKFNDNLYQSIGKDTSKCFGLNNASFSNYLQSDREIVHISRNVSDKFNCKVKHKKIFVFDALVEQGVVSKSTLLDLLSVFLDEAKNQVGISLKFHPAQSEDIKDSVVKLFKSRVEYIEILPENFVFEVFCIVNTKHEIYGIGSSVLLYSKIFAPERTFPMYHKIPLNKILDKRRYRIWQDMFERDLK